MSKKGIFLPLVLILLLVFAMIGLMFNTRAQTEFRQSYFTSDMLRAQLIADAALNEALAAIRADLNNNMRDTFIEGGELDIDLDLTEELKDDMLEIEDDATTNNVNISELEIKAECVNINEFNSCGDIMGTLVIEINVDLNSIKRDIKTSYDYKVVDIRPVGNEYTLMVNQAGRESFNVEPALYTNATGSKGISIGSPVTINLHQEYSKKEYNGIDLKKENKNSEESLIPGGKQQNKVSSPDQVKNNEPFENSAKGEVGNADKVHGGKTNFENKDECGPQVQFQKPGNFPFNCGYEKGNAYTHFFGAYCKTAANTTLFGNIKKRYTVKQYNYTNIPHTRSKEECDMAKAAKAAATATIVGAAAAEAAAMAAYMACACSNSNDWTDDDKWFVETWKSSMEKDYKTSESKLESDPVDITTKINFKNNFEDYKKSSTRYVNNFPEDFRDTFVASGRLYLEGLIACENVKISGIQTFQTPGTIVSKNNSIVSGNIKAGEKISSDIGEFFKQINALSIVSFNSIKIDNSNKENIGFYSQRNFFANNMNVNGNIVIESIGSAKKFAGGLTFDKKFVDSSFLIDSDKSFVVSLSPIPSSYIILNNN